MSDLEIAKLHEYHIGPRPLCAGCGESVEAGTVWIDAAQRYPWSGFTPLLAPDEQIYHYECKPAADSENPPQ